MKKPTQPAAVSGPDMSREYRRELRALGTQIRKMQAAREKARRTEGRDRARVENRAIAELRAIVDRGLELRAQIEQLKDELGLIEATLALAARQGEQVELTDPDREGRQFLARGTEAIVPVVLTADIIQATFADGGTAHAKVEAAAMGKIAEFYRATTSWKLLAKSGKAFRREAAALLGDHAPALITAAIARDKMGIPKSQIKVEWDRASEVKR